MIINDLEKIINVKIVFFGPALSGKTTSLIALFNKFGKKDNVLSIESTVRRTLFFDYGTVTFRDKPWKLKVHVYSTTGQDFYTITRPITLSAVDGIVFVADSQRIAYERNLISWHELTSLFQETLKKMSIVIAFNKQDLPDQFNTDDFLKEIDYSKYKNITTKYTTATEGIGIIDTFENSLRSKFQDSRIKISFNHTNILFKSYLINSKLKIY